MKSVQKSVLKIGTRESPLALIQTHQVQSHLEALGFGTQIIPIKTKGDLHTDVRLADIGGKALFTKELESALFQGEIDVAVHSMKDVEAKRSDTLTIGAYLVREDPRDGFISPQYGRLENLPHGATIGTSSPRRAAQLLAMYPHLNISPLRGNIQTRLEKTRQGHVDGTFLAMAGLKRAGLEDAVTQILESHEMLPAAGQGAIGVECLNTRADLLEILKNIDHTPTRQCVEIERLFQRAVCGDCYTPVGALAEEKDGLFTLKTRVCTHDGTACLNKQISGTYETIQPLATILGEGSHRWLVQHTQNSTPLSS